MTSAALYKVPYRAGGRMRYRLCVALPVTLKDLRAGLNANARGLHLFRGAWYGNDLLSIDTFGKIEGALINGRQVGKFVGRVTRSSPRSLRSRI